MRNPGYPHHAVYIKQILVPILALACLVAGMALPGPGRAGTKLLLSGSQDTTEVPQMKWLVLIYTEAFRRLGYDLQYDVYPLARLPFLIDQGKIDGEIQRPAAYQADHPNMIRLEVSPASVRYGAFAVKPGIALKGWESLRNTSFYVEYRIGASRSKTELGKVVPPDRLSTITTTEQGLKKLITGRTDLFIDLEHNITNAFKELNRQGFDTSTVYQAGLMQETPMYAYLHKKYADLVPKVSAELRAMKEEGLIALYRKQALEE